MAAPTQAQIAADATGAVHTHVADPTKIGGIAHTQTYTLPKLTPGGSAGSVTIVNGVVTSHTPPT